MIILKNAHLMISFLVYNKPGGQTEHTDTVIDADFKRRPWRYLYPTVPRPTELVLIWKIYYFMCCNHLLPPKNFFFHLNRPSDSEKQFYRQLPTSQNSCTFSYAIVRNSFDPDFVHANCKATFLSVIQQSVFQTRIYIDFHYLTIFIS